MRGGREIGFRISAQMKTGLFFGSFNPIHRGHVAIAQFMAAKTDLDEVWLVVSPHNPLKEKNVLADAKKRLLQVKKAIGKNRKIKVSDIELKLPKPSYTITTLKLLKKKYPKRHFVLIMGLDNLLELHKWKDYKVIIKNFEMYVYPRKVLLSGRSLDRIKKYPNLKYFKAPLHNISSTQIRNRMKKQKKVK